MDEMTSEPEHQKEPTMAVKTDEKTKAMVEKKQEMFDFFSKSHMMFIASTFAASQSPWRFNELRDELEIPRTTLSTRLFDLVERGLVTRHSYDEIPPHVEYEATRKLREFKPVISELMICWLGDDFTPSTN